MLDFLLAMTFCLSQFIAVMDFQYWSCKSWVSILVLDIEVLVLVLDKQVLVLILVLDKRVLNPSLYFTNNGHIDAITAEVSCTLFDMASTAPPLSIHTDTALVRRWHGSEPRQWRRSVPLDDRAPPHAASNDGQTSWQSRRFVLANASRAKNLLTSDFLGATTATFLR